MNITVYSTTTCPWCVKLTQWLKDNNAAFTEYKVDKNPYAAQTMISLSGQMGVPFTTIEHDDGSVDKIIGFDLEKLQAAVSR